MEVEAEAEPAPRPPPYCDMRRPLRACSPYYHPYRWLVVNCAIIFWSAFILALIWATHDGADEEEKTEVEWWYLVYNFGACAVWLVEVFFNVLDHRDYLEGNGGEESLLRPVPRTERTEGEVRALWIEAFLAAYFFVDSTSFAVDLTRDQIHRYSRGMTFDVAVNMAAYLFMVYRQVVHWRGSRQGEGRTEDLSDHDHKQEVVSEGVV